MMDFQVLDNDIVGTTDLNANAIKFTAVSNTDNRHVIHIFNIDGSAITTAVSVGNGAIHINNNWHIGVFGFIQCGDQGQTIVYGFDHAACATGDIKVIAGKAFVIENRA